MIQFLSELSISMEVRIASSIMYCHIGTVILLALAINFMVLLLTI